LAAGAALLAAGALALSGCASKGNSGNSNSTTPPPAANTSSASQPAAPQLNPVLPAGKGGAKCSGVSIAYIGALTGPNAALGIAISNAANLAVDQHNANNPDCQVTYKKFDSQGDPSIAPGVSTQAINEKDIIGVVGLPFSGESKAVGAAFNAAGLVTVSPSATNPDLSKNGWKSFHRVLGNDNAQGPAAASFITKTLGAKKVCVVEDDSDYGKGLATSIESALGSAVTCTDDVKTGQKDFSTTVNKVVQAAPDAVFYSGYYAEGGPFDQQLHSAGYKGKFIGPDGVKDPQFIKLAGDAAAEGAYFTCPCVPADASATFAAQYKAKYGTDPQTYSAESYDAATILLSGIDAGNTTRAKELNWVDNYNADGITKHIQFDSTGELAGQPAIWSYVVQNGQIVKYQQIGG
jgi:branched-chain amino acid transport system substrate-binding protein